MKVIQQEQVLADDLSIIIKVVKESDIKKLRLKITIVLALLQVIDLILTFRVLQLGGAEAGLAAKFLIGLGLIIPIKLVLAGFAVWRASKKPNQKEYAELPALCLACFGVGIYTLVGVLNFLGMLQLQ